MARIVVASHVVRTPLGGFLSWVLQWVLGFHQLGHDVYVVEKPGWRNSCYDPVRGVTDDDCSHGTRVWGALLAQFDLGSRWCFVDVDGRYHGLPKRTVDEMFRTADVFIDLTADAFGDPDLTWTAEAAGAGTRVFVDGEPGYYQARMKALLDEGRPWPDYDVYLTVGANVGTPASTVPDVGKRWGHVFYPVVPSLFPSSMPAADARFTTIMSWQAHDPELFRISRFAQKSVEFEKFADLPSRAHVGLELAIGGVHVPWDRLRQQGWAVRRAIDVTMSFDDFRAYILGSKGEFTVCKNAYVATNSGWFGDRAAAYLASGRPVVMQETGFSAHLPCGQGLFAVSTVDEAAAALDAIAADYERHSCAARAIASDYLDTSKVLPKLLDEVGV